MPVEKCELPAYIMHDLILWFRAVEENFVVHKVTKVEESAALVLAALPERHLLGVDFVPPSWTEALRSSQSDDILSGYRHT